MDARQPSHLSLPLLLLFYGGMAAVALGILSLFDLPSPWIQGEPRVPLWLGSLGGIGLGLLTHGLSMVARRRWAWARGFYDRLARAVGPASDARVSAAALTSGVAEELLFRGALLPLIGLVPQALIFGALHVIPGRPVWAWPLYATIMGLLFGILYQLTGSLLPVILAHFTVNYFGLSRLTRTGDDA